MAYYREGPLYENMTASAKPEVHNVAIATPQKEDQATATVRMHKKLMKFVHVVSEICQQTDRQTDKHTERHAHRSKYFARKGC